MDQKAVKCQGCGAEVALSEEYDTQFCPYCGGRLEAAQSILQEGPVWQPAEQGGSNDRPDKKPANRNGRTTGRWIAAVIAWAVALGIVLYLMEEVIATTTVSLVALFLASFPFWFPRFHPDAGTKKGTYLMWMTFMILIMAAIYFGIDFFA
jgi:hypothetical protein